MAVARKGEANNRSHRRPRHRHEPAPFLFMSSSLAPGGDVAVSDAQQHGGTASATGAECVEGEGRRIESDTRPTTASNPDHLEQ